MFDAIVRYLEELAQGDVSQENYKFSEELIADAIIILLKQIILSDGFVKPEELVTTMALLRDCYIKGAGEPVKLDPSRLLETKNQSIFPLAVVLRQSMSKAQLTKLKEHLVMIAKSDGEFHPYEEDLIQLFNVLTQTPK